MAEMFVHRLAPLAAGTVFEGVDQILVLVMRSGQILVVPTDDFEEKWRQQLLEALEHVVAGHFEQPGVELQLQLLLFRHRDAGFQKAPGDGFEFRRRRRRTVEVNQIGQSDFQHHAQLAEFAAGGCVEHAITDQLAQTRKKIGRLQHHAAAAAAFDDSGGLQPAQRFAGDGPGNLERVGQFPLLGQRVAISQIAVADVPVDLLLHLVGQSFGAAGTAVVVGVVHAYQYAMAL
ncbi:hypothetical protein SDC9_115742 [bioreactor metagenome]|uniref:Uncharacterized protein n=1 Tax=bioreactor metagenome TaxID=1076179 RepID=A0A645BUQ0_9ZZZZ